MYELGDVREVGKTLLKSHKKVNSKKKSKFYKIASFDLEFLMQ